MKQDSKWCWSKDCQLSCDELKRVLTSRLMNYDPDQSIIVASEAPEQGTGALLSHTFPDDSQKAVHHAKAERHYSKIAKKPLTLGFAVVYSTRRFMVEF